MVKNLTNKSDKDFEWLDLVDSDEKEIKEIASKYNLHEASVDDALQPDHLPKFEKLKGYIFVILRTYDNKSDAEADTIQELTDKLAIFLNEKFIITIHKNEWKELERISNESVHEGDCDTVHKVLQEIVKAGLRSFDGPSNKILHDVDSYEERVFLKEKKTPVLKGLYYIKRKADMIKRILLLSYDIVDNIDPEGSSNADTRDIRDLYVKLQSVYDSISENVNHLLNIYFNISAQKTNEIIRVLTIFSVFFMPLTFIVGIYGMNFSFMPELKWHWGYPGVMILMVVVTVLIYVWFKKKKWL